MRLPISEKAQQTVSEDIPNDLDVLIGNMKANLTVKCRDLKENHKRFSVRSSPYCVPRKSRTCSEFEYSAKCEPQNDLTMVKCSKCFQRHCRCRCEQDSLLLLKRLLSEQTLVQEAVRRLQTKTESAYDNMSASEHDWHSEGFTTRYTSYESEINTPGESDIDS